MKPTIQHNDAVSEFLTEERCYITELANSPTDPDASIARARVLPGVTTRWHRLRNTVERYLILEGRACVEVGDLPPEDLTEGDTVLIPAMVRQRITNTGSGDLVFLAICTPRFEPSAYEDVDQGEAQVPPTSA